MGAGLLAAPAHCAAEEATGGVAPSVPAPAVGAAAAAGAALGGCAMGVRAGTLPLTSCCGGKACCRCCCCCRRLASCSRLVCLEEGEGLAWRFSWRCSRCCCRQGVCRACGSRVGMFHACAWIKPVASTACAHAHTHTYMRPHTHTRASLCAHTGPPSRPPQHTQKQPCLFASRTLASTTQKQLCLTALQQNPSHTREQALLIRWDSWCRCHTHAEALLMPTQLWGSRLLG